MRTCFRSLLLFATVSSASCAHGPGPDQTIPQLRAAIDAPVESSDQNAKNSALVEQISNDRQIHEFTREELSERLGVGDPCHRHPICSEKGFDADDWYYEIGHEGGSYVRHRPALIVGFSRFGKVDRTFVLRAPE